ncbi:UPF0481 protein At3g47200 [Linum perenne]
MLRFNINVRASYSERFDKLSDTKLAEIMLLDGCFILELFLRYSNSDLRLESDPIFTTSWMVLTLQRDLILLENQIPFFHPRLAVHSRRHTNRHRSLHSDLAGSGAPILPIVD